MDNKFEKLTTLVGDILLEKTSNHDKLQKICETMKNEISHYNWVGFYIVDPKTKKDLLLGPFAGAPTEHTKIPFGKGICGQVAESNKAMTVQDVSQADNYIPCSFKVKSEIVVPVMKDGNQVAQLDIDSHDLEPFSDDDVRCLEEICSKIKGLF